MSKLSTPIVIVIGVVAVTVVIVVGIVANSALSEDDEPVVVESTQTSQPLATDDADDVNDDVVTAPSNGSNGNANGNVTTTVDADDQPLSKSEYQRVEKAALQIAGGGTVTDVGRSDDLGEAYEVEVLTDAGEVDVALDENMNRVPNLRYDD